MSKSTTPESGLIHPKTQGIINQMNLVFQYLARGSPLDYIQALKIMDLVIRGLKPEDKPIELQQKIKREAHALESYWYKSGRDKRINHMKSHYIDWYEEIDEALHNKGYYSGKAFIVFTPAEDMPQQNPKPVKKSYNERLRSDLE
jgi:hypothetical protein